jgi:hypothetical protein
LVVYIKQLETVVRYELFNALFLFASIFSISIYKRRAAASVVRRFGLPSKHKLSSSSRAFSGTARLSAGAFSKT